MKRDEILSLALDTLYGRRMRRNAGCFTANEAGVELATLDVSSLPLIEEILNKDVVPILSSSSFDDDEFPGLNYLVGAYLVIGVKHNDARILSFINGLPNSLLVEVILNIPIFFRKVNDTHSFGVAPSNELIEFVHQQTLATDEKVRQAATRALSFLPK